MNYVKNMGLDERKYIYILKSFAIFSIVCAHISIVPEDTIKINIIFNRILSSIGSIGVGIFFLLSGYLFVRDKKSFKSFFVSKVITIFIPWVFCGTVVYLYTFIRKDGVTAKGYINYLLGNGSYLWYLSVLVLLYFIYFNIKHKEKVIVILIILSILNIILTSFGLLDDLINPYLNPFNWMTYFSIGLLIKDKSRLKKFRNLTNKYLCISASIYIFNLSSYIAVGSSISYWSYFFVISELIAILLVFALADILAKKELKILILLGKESYSIYLLHMPLAGIVVYIFNKYNFWYATLLRPFIVVSLTLGCIIIYKKMFCGIKGELPKILIGLQR